MSSFRSGFAWSGLVGLGWLACGCRCQTDDHHDSAKTNGAALATSSAKAPSPRLLYLPDGGTPPAPLPPALRAPSAPTSSSERCPPEMVDVAGQFCIDRYEGVLIDARSGRRLSPFYYPSAAQARASLRAWQAQSTRIGPASARLMPVPLPPEWELSESFEPESRTLADEIPNGYLSADLAAEACARSGKRLCSEAEWVMACKGERQTKYPYGDRYQEGACNVFRAVHPAQLLHSDASAGHLDPRLNLVTENGAPLLQRTGSSPSCASHWGTDAAYDMVGNLDEWVDDPYGRFLGGFYSRNTREGCDARVSAHPRNYFDYSLGVRCCR